MATFTSNSYEGRYLKLTITEEVNHVDNSSKLTWTLTSTGGSSSYYFVEATKVIINGTTVYSKGQTQWSDNVFPAAKGSKSGTINVPHESDGTKSITVKFSTRVYYGGAQEYGGTMKLTATDRTAPTVSHSVSSLSTSGFKISVSANANCDIFQYSVDGGSTYTTFSTTVGKSASVTLSSLSSKTYSVRTRARKDKNELYGYSTKATVDIVPPTVTHGVSSITSSSFVISISASTTCDTFQYSIDGGTTYVTCSTTAGTSAKVTVSDLSPNTSYSVRVRARKKSNNLYGYSTKATAKTLGASVITSVTNFSADVSAPVISFKCTVYSTEFYHKVSLKTGSETLEIGTFKASASGTVSKSFDVSSSNRTKILSAMSDVKTKDMTLVLDTYSSSAYSTKIGSSSTKTIQAKTSSSVSAPTFTGFTYKEHITELTDVIGDDQILVQSLSQVYVRCNTGTPKNGATSVSYSATIGKSTVSSASTAFFISDIDVAGDLTLTVSCTDSRGYSTTKTATVTVIKYEKPKISKFVVKRKNDVEDIVGFSINASVSPVKVNGVQKNFPTNAVYRYKNVTENTAYEPAVSIFKSSKVNGAYYSDEIVDLGLSFDTECSFAFYFYMYDTLTSALNGGSYATRSKSTSLPAAKPLISLRKKNSTHDFRRVGINNNSPEFALDIGAKNIVDAFGINGRSIFDCIYPFVYPVGSVYIANAPDTKPANLFGGTWKLVDKGFKSVFSYSDNSEDFVSLISASASTVRVNRGGNTINLSCSFTLSAELTDTATSIATFNLGKVGITNFPCTIWFLGYTDGGNATVMLKIDFENGTLSCTDVLPSHSVPSGSSINFDVSVTLPFGSMVNDYCDKFYWQRTAL